MGMVQVAYTDESTYFTLQFTDMFGGQFTTRPVAVANNCTAGGEGGCRELQYALMELPNFAIPEVEVDLVDVDTSTSTTIHTYVVHFSDAANTGKQNGTATKAHSYSSTQASQVSILTTLCQILFQ